MAFGCSRGQFQYEVDVSHIEKNYMAMNDRKNLSC